MASRLFQGILSDMKSRVSFTMGVVDEQAEIVACTDASLIGERLSAAREFFSSARTDGECSGHTFQLIRWGDGSLRYAVFAAHTGDAAVSACAVVTVSALNLRSRAADKGDKTAFLKQILTDNILPGDISIRSRELDFGAEKDRVCFLIRTPEKTDTAVLEILRDMFPDAEKDHVLAINERETVLIKDTELTDSDELLPMGHRIFERIEGDLGASPVIGIGSTAPQLKLLARSYKEAEVAIKMGDMFYDGAGVMSYDHLGISRLIYQLPPTLCEMFLSEVFKKGSIDVLDEELLATVEAFFDNDLNISETARKLFVHRNTLVYRLDKIQKLTGLDLRDLDEAIVLKVAMMVKKYLGSRERFF